jgi:predicted RecA/RadA family phage recombinase
MSGTKELWSFKIEKPNLLIVEGYSDRHFIIEFLEHLGNHTTTDIPIVDGRDNFERQIPIYLQPPTLELAQYIGVVLDADTSATGSFAQIASVLKKCVGVNVTAAGVWVGDRPRYGIFVCPDNIRSGELETAAWESWAASPKNKGQLGCIERYLDCVATAGAKLKSPDKVRVGTMLAVHNEDDPRIGPGAQKRIFDFESPALSPMKAFLAPLVTKPPENVP